MLNYLPQKLKLLIILRGCRLRQRLPPQRNKVMRDRIYIVVVVLITCCCSKVVVADIISHADQSVVRIIARHAKGARTGTGFVVGRGGIVATNHHVVDGSDKIYVLSKYGSSENKRYLAAVSWVSESDDLVLLRVDGLEAPPLMIANLIPTKGSQVIAIGYPGVADQVLGNDMGAILKGDSTVSQGIIGRIFLASWNEHGHKFNIVQHGAAVNPGNSGGPLLDLCGRAVGVNTQRALGNILGNPSEGLVVNQSEGVFFASHVAVLMNALKNQGVVYSSTNDGCSLGSAVVTTNSTASSPEQKDWYGPAAIVVALLVAIGAMFVALQKTTRVREFVTRHKGSSDVGMSAHTTPKKMTWSLRGLDSQGRPIELIINFEQLRSNTWIIGRDPMHCRLAIDDPTVSRQHANVSLVDGGLQLRDLGSKNGTWINGKVVTGKSVTLLPSQTLTIGKVALMISEVAR